MTMKRSVALLSCAALLGACAKKADNAVQDTAAMNAAPTVETPAAAAMIPAGTWNGRTMPMDRDTVVASWKMVTTADTTGWTMTTSTGKTIPVRVISREGGSIVTEAGPYPSMVRKGQTVTSRSTVRLEGDSLVGTTEGRYSSKPDSVVRYRTVAKRAP